MSSSDDDLLEEAGFVAYHDDGRIARSQFPCPVCKRMYKTSNGLMTHMLIHENKKDYVCSICGHKTVQLGNLKTHMLIHSGERPYRCSKCGKRFKQSSNLIAHERIHTNEKPFECDKCFVRFRQKSGLNVHVNVHHTGEQEKASEITTYMCHLCKKRYKEYEPLIIHMRIHTGFRPFECGQCMRKFMFLHTLQSHMQHHKNDPNPNLIIID